MEILLTGYTAFLTQEWIETAFPDDHVLTTHTKSEALLDTRVKTVTLDGKQLLAQINEPTSLTASSIFQSTCCPTASRRASWTGCAGCCRPAVSGKCSCCTFRARWPL